VNSDAEYDYIVTVFVIPRCEYTEWLVFLVKETVHLTVTSQLAI